MILLCISLLFMPQPVVLNVKDYAHYYVKEAFNGKEWKCFNAIIYRESRWDDTAENGKHYGLGQLYGSKRYLKGDPRLQVRKTLDYITNRYETPCRAYAHHLANGWY